MHRHLVLLSQSQSCRGCGHPCQGVRWFFHWKLDIIYIYITDMHVWISWRVQTLQGFMVDGQLSIDSVQWWCRWTIINRSSVWPIII
jgi:hypothetical protein